MRSKEFLEKYKDIRLIAKELEKINTIFYTAVLFGSRAKEKATKNSDIDILLIAPSPEEIEKEANAITKMLSYPLHIDAISEESFDEMKNKKGLNVINEIRGNHIILAGHGSILQDDGKMIDEKIRLKHPQKEPRNFLLL